MRRHVAWPILAFAVAFVGCAGAADNIQARAGDSASVAPATGVELRLELGASAAVENGALVIAFIDVPTDSRCPKGEMCVWEGDAIVRLALRSGTDAGAAELHTSSRGSRTACFAGWCFELIALEPTPVAGKPAPQDYVAILRVAAGDATDGAIQ